MPRLPTFLIALTLLLKSHPMEKPQASSAISTASIPSRRVTGLRQPDVTASHPSARKRTPGTNKAHVVQHEYYNRRSDATFAVDHMCLARARVEGGFCGRANVGGDNDDWLVEEPYACERFPRTDEEMGYEAP